MTTLPPLISQPVAWPGDNNDIPPRFFDVRATVISQYANSPALLALIDAFGFAFDRQVDFDAFHDAVWNVDTAVGFGLDIWGRIVGVERGLFISEAEYLGWSDATGSQPFGSGIWYGAGGYTPNYRLTDAVYRRVILAKAALNITDGSIPAINAIMRTLFPEYGNTYVRDNADMTMAFVFGARPSKVDYAIVTQSGVMPRPAGVSFTIEYPI
jgi:hypothetical protein